GPRVLDIDPLDPANTALVLVDLQRKMVEDTVESMFPPNGRPDANIDGTSARLGRIQTVVLPNVRRLLAEFRRRGRHVLHFAAGPQSPTAEDLPLSYRLLLMPGIKAYGI